MLCSLNCFEWCLFLKWDSMAKDLGIIELKHSNRMGDFQ